LRFGDAWQAVLATLAHALDPQFSFHMSSDIMRVTSLDVLKVAVYGPRTTVTSHRSPWKEQANVMLMSTGDGRKYACDLPVNSAPALANESKGDTGAAATSSSTPDLADLVAPLANGECLQQDAGWWTFEYCHNK
jgi:hypothetical protein